MRPPHEEVEQESHEDDDQTASQSNDTPVESAQLLLSVDGTLLQIQRLLRDPTVLCEVVALSIANLLQQPVGSVVSFHRLPRSIAWLDGRERSTACRPGPSVGAATALQGEVPLPDADL